MFYLYISILAILLTLLVVYRPKISLFLLLALLPFNPFFKTFFSKFIPSSQVNILSLWKEFLALVLLIYGLYFIIKKKKKLNLFHFLIFILIALSFIISLANSFDLTTYIVGFKYSFIFLALIACLKGFEFSKKDLRNGLFILLTVGLIASIFALVQLFLPLETMKALGYQIGDNWQVSEGLPSFLLATGSRRVMGPMSGPNQLGIYLVLIVLLAAANFKLSQSKSNLLFILAFIIPLVAIFFTYSRTAWVSLIVGLLVLIVSKKWLSFKKMVYLILLIALIGLAVAPEADIDLTRQTDNVRMTRLRQSYLLLKDNLLGLGLGKVGPAAQWLTSKTRAVISENFFLQIGLETGIIGLALFALICYQITWQVKKVFTRTKDIFVKKQAAGLLAIWIAVLISGLFLHTLSSVSLSLTVAILTSLLIYQPKLPYEKEKS